MDRQAFLLTAPGKSLTWELREMVRAHHTGSCVIAPPGIPGDKPVSRVNVQRKRAPDRADCGAPCASQNDTAKPHAMSQGQSQGETLLKDNWRETLSRGDRHFGGAEPLPREPLSSFTPTLLSPDSLVARLLGKQDPGLCSVLGDKNRPS